MGTTSIEWTESTWNPVTGCTRVSKGCDLCYAATLTRRLAKMGSEKYQGLINDGKKHFNGVVKIHPETLDIPIKTSRQTTFFVNSMSDLFHPSVPQNFIFRVFETMLSCPQHTFQILTKRPARMQEIMPRVWDHIGEVIGRESSRIPVPLENVWLGTSVEDSDVVHRIGELSRTEASVRFLSCEPLLGPIAELDLNGIHWVIVGGESGPGARPFDVAWAEDIIAQCRAAGIACFVKQVGAKPFRVNKRKGAGSFPIKTRGKGGDPTEWPPSIRVREFPDGRRVA